MGLAHVAFHYFTQAQKSCILLIYLSSSYILQGLEQTIRGLEHDQFLKFWGYAPFDVDQNNDWRKEVFEGFDLDPEARKYLTSLFQKLNWNSPLYYGRWERTFIFFSKIVKRFLGTKTVEKLFSFETLEEQQEYIDQKFPSLGWTVILTILGNKAMFNALLYKGTLSRKILKKVMFIITLKAFSHLMREVLTKKSFFLQLCF